MVCSEFTKTTKYKKHFGLCNLKNYLDYIVCIK